MDSRKDLIFAFVVIALGIAVVLITHSFEEPLIVDAVGPRAFPYGLGLILILGGGIVFAQRLRNMNASGAYQVPSEGNDDDEGHPASGIRGMTMIALAFGYAAVLDPVGFLVATPVFLVIAFLLMAERNWLTILASAIGYTAVTYVVFGHLLNIRLPPGLLSGIIQ